MKRRKVDDVLDGAIVGALAVLFVYPWISLLVLFLKGAVK